MPPAAKIIIGGVIVGKYDELAKKARNLYGGKPNLLKETAVADKTKMRPSKSNKTPLDVVIDAGVNWYDWRKKEIKKDIAAVKGSDRERYEQMVHDFMVNSVLANMGNSGQGAMLKQRGGSLTHNIPDNAPIGRIIDTDVAGKIVGDSSKQLAQRRLTYGNVNKLITHSQEETLIDKLVGQYSPANVSRIVRAVKDPVLRKKLSMIMAKRIGQIANKSGDYYVMTGNVSSPSVTRTSKFMQNAGMGETSGNWEGLIPDGAWTEGRGHYGTILDEWPETASFYANPWNTARDESILHLSINRFNKPIAPVGWKLNDNVYNPNQLRTNLFNDYAYKKIGVNLEENPEVAAQARKIAFNDWLRYSRQRVPDQLPYQGSPWRGVGRGPDGQPVLQTDERTYQGLKRIKYAGKRYKIAQDLTPIETGVDELNRFYNRGDYETAFNLLSNPDNVIKVGSLPVKITTPSVGKYTKFPEIDKAISDLLSGKGWEKNAYPLNSPTSMTDLYGYPLTSDVIKELVKNGTIETAVGKSLIKKLVGKQSVR
jgi:hypothetical protein